MTNYIFGTAMEYRYVLVDKDANQHNYMFRWVPRAIT